MNSKTKRTLQDFITAIEDMVPQLANVVSTELLKELIDKGERLRVALDGDETILEVR